jgi:two-component system response regulator HydG
MLMRYDWPGNVRELENAIESALALAPGPWLRSQDLRLEGAARRGGASPPTRDVPLSLEAFERCALERALGEAGGDATEAARRLGIGRSTFYRKLARHGIPARRAAAGTAEPIR